jgi:hypothetical protein
MNSTAKILYLSSLNDAKSAARSTFCLRNSASTASDHSHALLTLQPLLARFADGIRCGAAASVSSSATIEARNGTATAFVSSVAVRLLCCWISFFAIT